MTVRAHLATLRDSWREETRRRRDGRQQWVETEFLPAALEVSETPPSPLGRAILWLIIAAAVLALAWASLSHVDTVAVAEGRIVPTGRLRTVEAADSGIVRDIAVREGDHVRAGELLIALDPTVAEADAETAQTEYATAALVRARSAALLASLSGVPARIVPPAGSDPGAVAAEQAAVDARVREYAARRGGLQERRIAAQATVRMTEANIGKIEQSLPLARQQVQAYETLAAQGYGSKLRLAQEQERYVGLSQDLHVERARRDEAVAQVAALSRELTQLAEEFRSQAAREGAEAEGVVATRGDQVRKAEQRQALQTLSAPVSGTVQEVAVTTLGQIAESGKALVTLVPDGEELVTEVLILNKDIGAVRAGDRAVVKLEAFPFTRYGTLEGVVERISPDSIVDERRGLVFPATVRLAARQPDTARRLRLSPGMAATAEIVTGRRRVIEYLWSPVAKAAREAGRER